jgi:hypothetical protein
MRRFACILVASALSITLGGCAKKPPTAAPTAPRPRVLATAPPEPISAPGVWFAFDPDFIRNRYRSADLAFGSFTISQEWRASAVHTPEACSGDDGEVHVGVYEDHMGLDSTETPFSSPVEGTRIAWGTVIEPPNVAPTQGIELEKREGTTVTFDGYFRVWNEGHYDDQTDRVPGGFSNPNHILELHPAWRVQAQDGTTRDYSLQAMSEYGGYGISKLKTILSGFASRTWPTLYQDADALYIHLPRGQPYEANFFQLPVMIRSVTALGDGILMQADVCGTLDCSGPAIYKDLRLVTVPSTDEGSPISGEPEGGTSGHFQREPEAGA